MSHKDEINAGKAHLNNSDELAMILSNVPGAVYRCQNDGERKIVFCSKEFSRLTDYPVDELSADSGKTFFSLIHPDDIDAVNKAIAEALVKGSGYEIEYRIIKADKSDIWVLDKGVGIKGTDGEVEFLEGIIIDFSLQKQKEMTIREQSNLIEGIINGIPDVLGIQNPDHTIVRYNQAGYDFLGMSPEEVKGKKCYELIGYEQECMGCATRAAYTSKKLERTQQYIPEMDKYLDCRSNPVLDEKGNIVLIIEQLRDITEQKHSEIALIESEKRYRLFAENASDVIWMMDITGKYLYMSPSVLQLRGYTPEEAMQHSFVELLTAASIESATALFTAATQSVRSGKKPEPETITLEQKCKDGRTIWTEIRVSAIFDEQDKFQYFLGVTRDITKRKRTEDELAEQKEYIESVLAAIPDLTFVLDQEGVFIDLKAGHSEELYLPREQFIGKQVAEVLPPALAQEIMSGILDLTAGRSIEPIQYKLPVGNSMFDFEARLSRLENDRVISVVRNITEQKQSEALQELLIAIAETYINTPLDNLDATINDSLREMGEFVNVDRAYIFDYNWEKYTCDNTYEWCAEGISPEIDNLQEVPLDLMPEWVEAHTHNHPMYIPDVQALSPDQQVRQILEPQGIKSLITIPLMDNGKCLGFVGFDSVLTFRTYSEKDTDLLVVFAQMLVNIRNRKISQELISSQISIQQLLTEISTDFVSVDSQNIDDKINKLLKETGEYFGVDRSYILSFSTDLRSVSKTHEWVVSGLTVQKQHLKDFSTDRLPWMKEQVMTLKTLYISDVEKLPDESALERQMFQEEEIKSLLNVPILCSGKVIGLLGFDSVQKITRLSENQLDVLKVIANTLSDAYAKVSAEKELIKSRDNAEAANRAKSEFLANISHEIRTPMNSILGFSEVMLNTTQDAKEKNYLKTILDSGKTLLSLINDILDLSKIEAGRMEISPEPADLRVIIREIEQLFHQKVREKNIKLIIDIDEDFPQAIMIDEVRLRQVLLNLTGNAVKFTHEGFVKIEVNLLGDKQGIINFEIAVIDSGIGIAEAEHQWIFESFHQQSGQDSRKYGGTGLGLTISKRLCELMHGTISLESQPGKGSSFTVRFADIKYSDQVVEQSGYFLWEEDDISFKGSKILIIDDVAHNRNLVLTFLEKYDLQLLEAENGEMGVEMAKAFLPDLIFMDIRMPGMNGYTATEILKHAESTSDIPIVALTASTMKSEIEELRKLFDGYLRKPVQKKSLVNEIMKFLPFEKLPEHIGKADVVNPETKAPVAVNQELKELFLKEFQEDIAEEANLMIMDNLSRLADRFADFAAANNISQLGIAAIDLQNYIADFNFEGIHQCLGSIEQIFSDKGKQL